MPRDRVIVFIDGLNLFHAICRLKIPHLNWLDPVALSKYYIRSRDEEITQILYFSALATHLDESSQKRDLSYITALRMRNIKPILGQFKEKDRYCPKCFSNSRAHEEKETDVNIALALLNLAYQNAYDRALLISNDSDLAPAIRTVRELFPQKRITIVAPPLSRQCNELIQVASNKMRIRVQHLEKSLLPEVVVDASRMIFVNRPREYAPILASRTVL
jgi:uncharacterized LabA/DUF88 family protein